MTISWSIGHYTVYSGINNIQKGSYTKLIIMKCSPATPARIWTHNLSITSLALLQKSYPDPYSVSVPQWHVKDPGHPAKSADGRLHLNTTHPGPNKVGVAWCMPLSRHSVETYPGNELPRNLSGNFQPQLSHLTEPLWNDPDIIERN